MRLPPLLSTLACLLSAALAPRADTAGTEAARPAGKLLPSATWDGHTFLALGNPLPAQTGPDKAYWALVARWNPTFLGWEARLAGVAEITPLPEVRPEDGRLNRSAAAWDEAWLRYPFAPAGWAAAFQAGRFRWRSHSDASLLGEYTVRWTAYPSLLYRPARSWDALDSLTIFLTGLRFSLASPGGRLRQEVLAVKADEFRDFRGTFYWSGAVSPLRGLDLGMTASVYTTTREPLVTAARNNVKADTVDYVDTTGEGDKVYYKTFGTWFQKVSVRTTVDIMALINGVPRRDRGGRLFVEAEVLGWENHSFYYEDRSSRIYGTAGLDLPGLGLLDRLRIQANRSPVHPFPDYSGSGQAEPRFYPWSAQIFLSRALLPWLDVQAWALRQMGRPVDSRPRTWGMAIPAVQPASAENPDPSMLWQMRLSIRL